jgi:hypothetical protein
MYTIYSNNDIHQTCNCPHERRLYWMSCVSLSVVVFCACVTEKNASVVKKQAETLANAIETPKRDTKTQASVRVDEGICQTICNRSAELKCGPVTACIDGCRLMLTTEVCANEMRAFLKCVTREPSSHFECADRGVAAIKEGYCGAERQRVALCIAGHADKGAE